MRKKKNELSDVLILAAELTAIHLCIMDINRKTISSKFCLINIPTNDLELIDSLKKEINQLINLRTGKLGKW